jgi:hypothetical protein
MPAIAWKARASILVQDLAAIQVRLPRRLAEGTKSARGSAPGACLVLSAGGEQRAEFETDATAICKRIFAREKKFGPRGEWLLDIFGADPKMALA